MCLPDLLVKHLSYASMVTNQIYYVSFIGVDSMVANPNLYINPILLVLLMQASAWNETLKIVIGKTMV